MEEIQEKSITREIFKALKPHFKDKLGKYTHQRISGDWHFHGLGFVMEELTYVFGFNIGFFRKNKPKGYDVVGMNVLVRTNGMNQALRKKYNDFFAEHLKDWYFSVDEYHSFRGGIGTEYARYREVSSFKSNDEIIAFLIESINLLHTVYPKIYENPDGIFENVMRASFPWHDTILDVCAQVLNIDQNQ